MHKLVVPIKLAIKNLRSNIGRTILSLVGIVIGVTAVILVLSLGGGVKSFLVDQVSSFGTDIIQVEIKVPKTSKTSSQNSGGIVGGTQITTLKLEDAQKIAKLKNVSAWYAGMMGQQIISYDGKDKSMFIMGVTPGVTQADEKAQVESGAMFTDSEESGLSQVVVLGSDAKEKFFGDQEAIGKTIKIKGQSFKVMGVLKKRGMTGMFNFDEVIYMPLETLQKKLLGIDHIQFAIFKLKDMKQLDLTILEVADIMRAQHDITDPNDDDFAVNSIVEIIDILDKVFFAVNALLIALTSISLVVGGVGIMNVMYVTVVERTYEIGLRKAIGARNSQIMSQFLFEAIFLTLLGGIIGIVLGAIISKLAVIIMSNLGYTVKFPITWWAVAIGAGFSILTGMIFGYYPAKKASQLSPMEALRKE